MVSMFATPRFFRQETPPWGQDVGKKSGRAGVNVDEGRRSGDRKLRSVTLRVRAAEKLKALSALKWPRAEGVADSCAKDDVMVCGRALLRMDLLLACAVKSGEPVRVKCI